MVKSLNDNNIDNCTPNPDLTYLRDMADGDETFIKDIITIFLANGPTMISSLRDSALEGDHEKVKFISHKLIPQLTFVGILSVIPEVRKINKESEILDDLVDRINNISKVIDASIEHLKKEIEP